MDSIAVGAVAIGASVLARKLLELRRLGGNEPGALIDHLLRALALELIGGR